MTPLLASASADGAAVVMSPVVPKSHDDPSTAANAPARSPRYSPSASARHPAARRCW